MPHCRSLLCAAIVAAACSPAAPPASAPAPAPTSANGSDPSASAVREQTADQQIRQALDRLTFGPRPGDYEKVHAMGVDRWINLQLHPERIDDRATEQFMAHFPTLALSPSDLVREYPPPQLILAAKRKALRRDGGAISAADSGRRAALSLSADDSAALQRARQRSQQVTAQLQTAKVARAVMTDRQLQEVMVDFWENHFNVFVGKGAPERYFLASYERDAIRPHALGKFRDLLEAVAKSPAMLFYLDNWESTADSAHPTLADYRARGRRFASFRARTPRRRGINENYGRELLELHTLGVNGGYTQQDVINVARAFTGWTIQNPRQDGEFIFRPAMHDAAPKIVLGHHLPAGRGIEDGEEVLDIIARHPSTAHFIATKLVRRFVSDSPPPALIDRAAATFQRTDGDIREVLRTIFTSPEFFSRAAYHAKVKTPFELVVSALRAVDAQPDSTPRTARLIARLGEPIFGHRDPNGYPDIGDAWINTGSILDRINFGLAFATGRMPGVSLPAWEHEEHLDTLPNTEQVDGVIGALLGGEASPDTRKILDSGTNPLLPNAPAAPRSLEQTIGLALGAPEFQRR